MGEKRENDEKRGMKHIPKKKKSVFVRNKNIMLAVSQFSHRKREPKAISKIKKKTYDFTCPFCLVVHINTRDTVKYRKQTNKQLERRKKRKGKKKKRDRARFSFFFPRLLLECFICVRMLVGVKFLRCSRAKNSSFPCITSFFFFSTPPLKTAMKTKQK